MRHADVQARVTFEAFESRRLLSAGPDPIAYDVGSQEIRATAASADAHAGDMLLAGSFATGNDFQPGPGIQFRSPTGEWSPFLARYAPDGRLIWVNVYAPGEAYADGATYPVIAAVAAGPDGSVYAAGTFSGRMDLSLERGSDDRSLPDPTLTTTPPADGDPAHGADVFLARFDRNGKYVWGRLINNVTTGTEAVSGLAVDRFGSAYLAGTYATIAGGALGPVQSFLTKLTPDGSRAWGASLRGAVSTVAIDHHDAPWVAVGGEALRIDQFTAGRGRFASGIGAAAADNSAGHGIGSITARSIAFDAHDNVVLSGDFSRTFDFAPGTDRFLLGDKRYNPAGASNIFLSKLRPGGELVFAMIVGGTEADNSAGAGVDRRTGEILLSGTYSGKVDLDPARHAATYLDAGFDAVDGDYPSDVFTARYTPTGRLMFARDHTTVDDDTAAGFAMTPSSAFVAASNFDQKRDTRHIILFELPLA